MTRESSGRTSDSDVNATPSSAVAPAKEASSLDALVNNAGRVGVRRAAVRGAGIRQKGFPRC